MHIEYIPEFDTENRIIVAHFRKTFLEALSKHLISNDKTMSNNLSNHINNNIDDWIKRIFNNYDNSPNISHILWDYIVEKINDYIKINGKD